MNLRSAWDMLRQTYDEWSADKAPRLGAALAYYTAFSLAPLLVIAIAVASLVFGERAAQGEIVKQIEGTIGPKAAEAIQDMLKNTHASGGSVLATIVGFVLLFFGASGVFVELQDSLDTVWKVKPKPDRGFLDVVRDRFLSFTVVLGTGFLLLVSLILSAGLAAVGKFWASDAYIWQGVNSLVSFAFVTLLFALIFKLLPDATVAWQDVWIGAALTALLFTVGKYLIGLYLGQGSTATAFGAAGSLAIILIWVYYSAQILLFGAEFTRVYALRRGATVRPTANAEAVTASDRARQGLAPAGQVGAVAS